VVLVVGHWDWGSSNRSHGLHHGLHMIQRHAVDDGVESVDRVRGVLHNALEAIGINQGVLSADHVAIALLHLALGVAGEGVLHIVGELVLGMGVVLLGGLGQNRLGVGHGNRRMGVGGHGGSGMVHLLDGKDSGTDSRNEGENSEELKTEQKRVSFKRDQIVLSGSLTLKAMALSLEVGLLAIR